MMVYGFWGKIKDADAEITYGFWGNRNFPEIEDVAKLNVVVKKPELSVSVKLPSVSVSVER